VWIYDAVSGQGRDFATRDVDVMLAAVPDDATSDQLAASIEAFYESSSERL